MAAAAKRGDDPAADGSTSRQRTRTPWDRGKTRTTTAARTEDAPKRTRSIPEELEPPQREMNRGPEITARFKNAFSSVLASLDRLEHPVARAHAAGLLAEALSEALNDTKDVRRAAVVQAYEDGQQVSGWYGFGTLGEQLGISGSRVRQIVFDVAKGEARDKTRDIDEQRRHASAVRSARKMLAKGTPAKVVAETTGLSLKDVEAL